MATFISSLFLISCFHPKIYNLRFTHAEKVVYSTGCFLLTYRDFYYSLITAACNAFELGTERSFSFVNDVNLYELKLSTSQAIGYRTSGHLKISTVHGDNENGFLLRFEVNNETQLFYNLDLSDRSFLAWIAAIICREIQSSTNGLWWKIIFAQQPQESLVLRSLEGGRDRESVH